MLQLIGAPSPSKGKIVFSEALKLPLILLLLLSLQTSPRNEPEYRSIRSEQKIYYFRNYLLMKHEPNRKSIQITADNRLNVACPEKFQGRMD